MTILVTGSTGTIGAKVVAGLAAKGASVKALTRSAAKANFPAGVVAVEGDLMEPDTIRAALAGVDTLFLLVANGADEMTAALVTVNLAREAGVKGIVYLSVLKAEEFGDVPHFTSKFTVERLIDQAGLPATILRPAYFMQNDLNMKAVLTGPGIYGMPVGQRGIAMVDVRDIADAAVAELLRREAAPGPLPREIYEVVGPDLLTGPALAAIWTAALGRTVNYGGDDLDPLEARLRGAVPAWLAYDMRQMMRRYQEDGAAASPGAVERLTALLGHAPRSYRAFATEAAQGW